MLLTGDPAIIGVCSLVSDITNGRFNLLKWDRQERYYPIEICTEQEQRMTIDFEKDQEEVLDKTTNINKLADKIKQLQAHQQQLEVQEDAIKQKKKDIEHLSGEIIPTMLSEMGLSF